MSEPDTYGLGGLLELCGKASPSPAEPLRPVHGVDRNDAWNQYNAIRYVGDAIVYLAKVLDRR